MASMSDWLRSIGLHRLEDVLLKNDINLDVLHSLSEPDLDKLGVSMGDRKRLLQAIGTLPHAVMSAGDGGEVRQLTIMFCDLVDSTALCERLNPEQWREVVLAYQQAASTLIERLGGVIAQYLGDGLLVYFGYPQAHEDAPERAVRAALALVATLNEVRITVSPQETVRLSVRVGIDTGVVVIGSMGAGPRREQLALGDAPNLAARLQTLAAPDTVLISDNTRKLAGGSFQYQDQGQHVLRGVREPRQVWRVMALSGTSSRFEAATGLGLTPLVGRQHELALLMDRWHAASQGLGQVVLLSGEPGIGKSRMLKELHDRLGNVGLNAIRMQCSPHHVNRALHPGIEHLESTLGLTRDQPLSWKLDRLESWVVGQLQRPVAQAALLAAMLSIPAQARYGPLVQSPVRHEQDTIEALADLMVAEVRRGPTLMLLEDAHWADPATVVWLKQLVERARHWPLLLVVTHRPEFEPGLDHHAHVTALRMGSLGQVEVTSLVSALMAGRADETGLSSELTHHIVSKTDGVPLFVEELTKSLLDAPVDARSLAGQTMIPATLRDSLMARLDRVSAAKEIAQIGSVVGRTFSLDLLKALSRWSDDELADALAALTQSGLATERTGQQGTVYTFKHALVQDAAYDSLLKTRREALHGAMVRVLQERFPAIATAEPELVAHHATAAGQPQTAIPYWRRASELALQRLALRDAVAHLSAGLASASTLPPSPQRDQTELQLQAALGTVHMLGKGWAAPEVVQSYVRAHELADAADQVEESIWPLWGVCVFQLVRGEITQAQAVGRRMMTVARQSNSRTVWLVANMMHTQLCLYSGELDRVAAHGDQVEHRYRDPQDRGLIALYSTDLKLVSMVHGSQARWICGDVDDAAALCEQQERFATSLDHPYSWAWTLTWGAMSYLHRGDVDGLLVRAQEGLRIARQHGFAYVAAIGTFAQGWGQAQQGDLEGIDQMRCGLAAFRDTGAGIAVPFFQTLLADALGQVGRQHEGLALLDDAARRIEQGGERWHEAESHRIRGRLLAMGPQADVRAAEVSLQRAIEVATDQHALSWQRRAVADLARLRGA
ncbi:MAG: AAA family ATPase [Burkholderiales bacterium]|nr:AAA family ATPase [Burkholderiales bacterium]